MVDLDFEDSETQLGTRAQFIEGDHMGCVGRIQQRAYGTIITLLHSPHLHHLVALYMDLKYGLKVAPWDQEQYTMEELGKVIKGFQYATEANIHTIVMWVEIGQVGAIRGLLESQGYENVQPCFWYKVDMNVVGPVYKRTSAVKSS